MSLPMIFAARAKYQRELENHQSWLDVELANTSNASVSSNKILKKEKLDAEESSNKTEVWCQWLKYRIRHYMILEVLFFIILVLILTNSYHISSQNEKTYKLISNIQSQIDKLEKKLNSNSQLFDRFKNKKDYEENKKFEEPLMEIKNNKNNIQKEIIFQSDTTSTSKQNYLEPTTPSSFSQKNHSISSTNCSQYEYNAASYLMGASVDRFKSSRSVKPEERWFDGLESFLIGEQNEHALLDRKELPSDKAWCSIAEQPILTVELANYINPIAVSYQHTKWNGTVPNGAPAIYDLMACVNTECQDIVPLVTNCKYKAIKNQPEQICEIPTNFNKFPIKKVQFHFRKNHGRTEKTCVYSVRVYGGPKLLLEPISKKKQMEYSQSCSELAWHYHKNPTIYKLKQKNCTILYEQNCCNKCPECCLECEIHDFNLGNISIILFIICFISLLLTCCLVGIFCPPDENKSSRL